MTTFTHMQLEAIVDALGDMPGGLTEREISDLLETVNIRDLDPDTPMRQRLFNAFADLQTARNDRTHILAFICNALKPDRFSREPERFEAMRANVNRALALAGLTVSDEGKLEATKATTRLSEASRRARELRADLTYRGTHPEVLRFCQQELLAENYFRVVAEAVKSIADKIRARTGLEGEGAALVDQAFGGDRPMLAINALTGDCQRNEQRAFANLITGTLGFLCDRTSHEPDLHWQMTLEDAEDLLCLVSLIHRRIDAATTPSLM